MKTRRRAAGSVDALTPRQREVFELLAKGCSNREIAGALGVAAATVKTHVEHVLRVLDVANRTEAAALASQLARGAGAAATPSFGARPAIAVLRFDAMPSDEVTQAVAAGLVDDLIAQLCRWRWFPVIARSTSFFYGSGGTEQSTATLRARTGATYFLGGSIVREDRRLHVVARLDDAAAGRCLWSERFELDVEEVFTVQAEVAALVVGRAYPEILEAEGRVALRSAPQLSPWQLAHAGWLQLDARDEPNTRRAIELFARAAMEAPSFVLPIYGMGMALFQQVANQWTDRIHACCAEIERSARRAIAIDERDASGWVLAGRAALAVGDARRAIGPLEKATALNPSHATAHSLLGQAYILDGNHAGFESLRRAARLSPRAYASGLAFAHFAAQDYPQAIATCHDALVRRPDYVFGRALLCAARSLAGDVHGASEERRQLLALHPDFRIANIRHAVPAGRIDTADRLVEGLRLAGVEE